MNEMVERVALVMRKAVDGESDPDYWREVARAAIEAMREPTQPMEDLGDGYMGCAAFAITVWHAMIDRSLGKDYDFPSDGLPVSLAKAPSPAS